MVSRIVIDARMVGSVPHGIERYVTNLAQGFFELQKKETLPYEIVFLVGSGSKRTYPWSAFHLHETSVSFLSARECVLIPGILKKLNATLYHSPSFSSLLWCPCPWAMTVHDLNHLQYGKWSKRLYYHFLLKPFARKSSALLSVSEFSRGALSEWLRIPRDSIGIVSNAVELPDCPLSGEDQSAVMEKYGLSEDHYFFCLANAKAHKNLDFLVESYLVFRKKNSGKNPWPLALSVRSEDLLSKSLDGVLTLGSLSETDAGLLLSKAGALVSPSKYEGFGRVPVEAALRGIPLLVSKIPPHLEALQDLKTDESFFIAPDDLDGWIHGMEMAVSGRLLKVSMESRRKIQSRYSIEKLVKSMDRIYRRILFSYRPLRSLPK